MTEKERKRFGWALCREMPVSIEWVNVLLCDSEDFNKRSWCFSMSMKPNGQTTEHVLSHRFHVWRAVQSFSFPAEEATVHTNVMCVWFLYKAVSYVFSFSTQKLCLKDKLKLMEMSLTPPHPLIKYNCWIISKGLVRALCFIPSVLHFVLGLFSNIVFFLSFLGSTLGGITKVKTSVQSNPFVCWGCCDLLRPSNVSPS